MTALFALPLDPILCLRSMICLFHIALYAHTSFVRSNSIGHPSVDFVSVRVCVRVRPSNGTRWRIPRPQASVIRPPPFSPPLAQSDTAAAIAGAAAPSSSSSCCGHQSHCTCDANAHVTVNVSAHKRTCSARARAHPIEMSSASICFRRN